MWLLSQMIIKNIASNLMPWIEQLIEAECHENDVILLSTSALIVRTIYRRGCANVNGFHWSLGKLKPNKV